MPQVPLSNYLRMHRRRVGWTQSEVAYLLGIRSGTNVSRHETHDRRPSLELILGYELILGVPASELYAGEAERARREIRSRARRLAKQLEVDSAGNLPKTKQSALRRLQA